MAVVDLLRDRAVADDRSRDELREQTDVEQQLKEAFLRLDLPPIAIHDIAHYLERIEAYSRERGYIGHGQCRAERRVYIRHHKAAVFYHGYHSDVEDQPRGERGFLSLVAFQPADPYPDEVIHRRGYQQQPHAHGLSPRVEEQRAYYQNRVFPFQRLDQSIANQTQRQKRVCEYQAGKYQFFYTPILQILVVFLSLFCADLYIFISYYKNRQLSIYFGAL